MKCKMTVLRTRSKVTRLCGSVVAILLLLLALPGPSYAYVDPGTTGMISQLLYLLFYAALGMFFVCIRYLKKTGASVKQRVLTLFRTGASARQDRTE